MDPPCSPVVLPLEPRRLLAVSLLPNGMLSVTGTNGNDSLVLNKTAGVLNVSLNGVPQTFAFNQVTSVQFSGRGGDDTLRVRHADVPSVNLNKNSGALNIEYVDLTRPIFATITNGPSGIERSGGIDTFTSTDLRLRGTPQADTFSYFSESSAAPMKLNILGGAGNDYFRDDVSDNPAFNVTLNGESGDDAFEIGESVADTVLGGDGRDTLILADFAIPQSLDLGAGEDTVMMSASALETLDAHAWAGVEVFSGVQQVSLRGPNNAVRYDVSGASTIVGGNGNDRIVFTATSIDGGDYDGGGGGNTLDFSRINDPLNISLDGVANDSSPFGTFNVRPTFLRVYTGAGDDTLAGTASGETIDGGAGDDSIDGNSGNDYLVGNFGDDVIRGGGGDDTLEGSAGRDRLEGQGGSDLLIGGANPDSLFGDSGPDTLSGGGGNDLLFGGTGADQLFGNAGDDRLFADGDFVPGIIDTLDGGRGLDSASADDEDLLISIETRLNV